MTYNENIKNILKSYVRSLESIGKKETLPIKVLKHFDRTVQILKTIDGQLPENYKQLIEFLYQESRNFGWSYPENLEDGKCETEFWQLKESIKSIVQGMTVNERLYLFGYLEDYEKLKPIERSAREKIEYKLFIERETLRTTRYFQNLCSAVGFANTKRWW